MPSIDFIQVVQPPKFDYSLNMYTFRANLLDSDSINYDITLSRKKNSPSLNPGFYSKEIERKKFFEDITWQSFLSDWDKLIDSVIVFEQNPSEISLIRYFEEKGKGESKRFTHPHAQAYFDVYFTHSNEDFSINRIESGFNDRQEKFKHYGIPIDLISLFQNLDFFPVESSEQPL